MKLQSYCAAVFCILTCVMAGCQTAPSLLMNPDNAIVDALDTLRQAAEDKDAAVQSNAIEALAQTVGRKEGGLYLQALGSPNPMVQFAATMAVGDLKYEPAKPVLDKMADAEGARQTRLRRRDLRAAPDGGFQPHP